MTIFGWDASDYDWTRGSMDLAAAARDGIMFFTHKFTEGVTVRHVHAADATNRARAAGIPFIGGYHVVRTGPSAADQVAYLLGYADAVTPWWRTFDGWFWQVDLELWSYDAVSAATGHAFAAELQRVQPKTVITYASNGQYGGGLAGFSTRLWNASYGSNTAGHYLALYPGDGSIRWNAYSGQTPVILQYGSLATIGSQTGCDANAFRGSKADFAAMIGGADMTPEEHAVLLEIQAVLRMHHWMWAPSAAEYQRAGGDPAIYAAVGPGNLVPALGGLPSRVDAASAGDAARDAALLAAIHALAVGGTSVDTAAVIAAVNNASGAETAAVAALGARIAELTTRLAAAQAKVAALEVRLVAALAEPSTG